MSDPRAKLPNRRPQLTERLSVGGVDYDISVGADPDTGAIREIFITGPKENSELWRIANDAALVLSIAIQCGVPAEAFARSIARLPEAEGRGPASVIGAAADLAVRLAGEIPACAGLGRFEWKRPARPALPAPEPGSP